MKVSVNIPNPALLSLFANPNQIITLDSNFLIPPDRSRYAKRGFDFPLFKKVWLDPIFLAFPKLAIHESVHEEMIVSSIQSFIRTKLESTPPRIIIHEDKTLTTIEKVLRDSIEAKIYLHTNYEPLIDNRDDRGEVKSLAFIAVKGLLYFAAHDNNAIQLIEKAELWSTGLDNVQAIKMYELIYYLYALGLGDNQSLRMLYKYQYYLTDFEKKSNPEWGEFVTQMNVLYKGHPC